jgi:hypothetical protein
MAATKNDYDQVLIDAAQSVLLELVHLLQEYRDGIVVVGGLVPGLLFNNPEVKHVGSIDVDLALDHEMIHEAGYRTILELLLSRGYLQGSQPFIFYRNVVVSGNEIKVEVDFLAAEYGGTNKKHRTQKVQGMQPRKARGCDLAFRVPTYVTIEGTLPGGGKDIVKIRVASIAPFILMKAHALENRLKEKDAYDIYYCLRNYPDGLDRLAEEFQPYLDHPLAAEGLEILAKKFNSPEHVGPIFVVDFLNMTDPNTRAMSQRDVYERMDYLLRRLGIRA